MAKTNELSAPLPLELWVEKTAARLSPRDALRFYVVTNDAARRRIAAVIRRKIPMEANWSPEERQMIARYLGVHVLEKPGPLEPTARRAGR